MDAQVNKQTYALCSLPVQSRTYRAPVKSTPVTVKGVVSSTLYLVNGGGSGAAYGLPGTLLHVTHFRTTDWTHWRIYGIQYFCRRWVMTEVTPEWSWEEWASVTIRRVIACLAGKIYGNLASSCNGALCIMPPQRMSPVSSRNSLSCLTKGRRIHLLSMIAISAR